MYLLTRGGSSTAKNAKDVTVPAAGARDAVLGGGWDGLLREELDKPYWSTLLEVVAHEQEDHEVYPPWPQTFKAIELTRYQHLKVVMLGQDPYINPGQAHGLAFSVRSA